MIVSVAIIPPSIQRTEETELPVTKRKRSKNTKKPIKDNRIKSFRHRSLLRAVKRTEHDNYKEL